MQSLLGGADCSTSSNPLKQFAQREAVDNSLFRDRHAGPSSSQRPFGAFQPATNGPQITGRPQQVPQPFNLSHLSSALSSTEVTSGPPLAQQFRPQWNGSQAVSRNGSPFTDEFAQHQNRPNQTQPQHQAPARMHSPSSDWASSFAPSKGKMRESPLMPTSAPQYPQDQYSSAYQPRMNNYSSFTPMYSGYNAQMSQPQAQLGPQQRSVEEQKAMEDAFEKALEDARAQTASENVQEDVEQKEEAKEEQVDESDGTYTAEGEFEKVWQSLRPEAERLGKLAEWEKDFSQFVNEEDDLYDILNESLNREDLGQTSLEDQMEFGTGQNWQDGMREEEVVKPKEYDFTFPNQFDQIQKPIQAYWQANGILQAGGSLTSASLLVESFIRRISAAELAEANLTEVDAWSMLGRIHAMNEKEEKALSAFEEGRKLLEAKPEETNGAGEMLTNLAISYVNESQDLAALNTLHQFLSLVHPKHAGLAPSQARLSGGNSPWALHQQLTDSYLSLAKEQYGQNGTVDPDVQVGLGTLYYTMGEYDQARDCWAAALGEKPGDYLLWNRLGATLANSGNSEEAVDAYRRALELKPTYTRAIFNLGVACLNIGVHREAAEHFLAALSLHARSAEGTDLDDGKDSLTLWMTLRRALTSLDLRDLAEKATPGTDLAVFRAAGFEF